MGMTPLFKWRALPELQLLTLKHVLGQPAGVLGLGRSHARQRVALGHRVRVPPGGTKPAKSLSAVHEQVQRGYDEPELLLRRLVADAEVERAWQASEW